MPQINIKANTTEKKKIPQNRNDKIREHSSNTGNDTTVQHMFFQRIKELWCVESISFIEALV